MVCITVQNLVGIDAVVLIICTFFDFAFGLKMPICAPKLFFDLPNVKKYRKKAHPCARLHGLSHHTLKAIGRSDL